MLTKDGLNGSKNTLWTLRVPDEHCQQGLEVKIEVGSGGISIGGQVIDWNELEVAKLRARGCEI